jgi:hypothetical protein
LRRRALLGGFAGLVAGVLVGVAALTVASVAVAHRLGKADVDPAQLIEATHVPPLLTVPGEPVALSYDVYCAPPDGDDGGERCDAGGTVYLRAAESGAFRAVQLHVDEAAEEGRYVAEVPAEITASPSGFTYYAVVRNLASGAETTIPAGGAAAPQRSLPLGKAVTVRLGAHAFGRPQRPAARVASAPWGDGPGEVALESDSRVEPVGASSFDVDSGGAVTILDEGHRRALRWRRGASAPDAVSLAVNGTLADLAVDEDGSMYVLETGGGRADGRPLLRSFDRTGRARAAWRLAERTAAQVRLGPDGPLALQYPAGQWLPVAERGRGLSALGQKAHGRPGRTLRDGAEVVVLRTGDEIRVALVPADGTRRSWRVTSETPLGEVQLAEPLGGRLVLVFRTYTDDRDEFVALVLDGRGVVKELSLDSADWAETAPLSRFRLAGSSLYQLGSTPAAAFVDRFDLEAPR